MTPQYLTTVRGRRSRDEFRKIRSVTIIFFLTRLHFSTKTMQVLTTRKMARADGDRVTRDFTRNVGGCKLFLNSITR